MKESVCRGKDRRNLVESGEAVELAESVKSGESVGVVCCLLSVGGA